MENVMEFAVNQSVVSETERLLVFLMDNREALISWQVLQEGVISASAIDVRRLVEIIIGTNATQIALSHYCAKGKVSLRRPDLAVADKICDVLGTIGVGMKDYLVVGADGSVASFSTVFGRNSREHP